MTVSTDRVKWGESVRDLPSGEGDMVVDSVCVVAVADDDGYGLW
jgi:hypothetical protein